MVKAFKFTSWLKVFSTSFPVGGSVLDKNSAKISDSFDSLGEGISNSLLSL